MRTPEHVERIAVYMGSSMGQDPRYREAATATGHELARRGIALVYGGGKVGLMGTVADAVLERGGIVHGIITDELQQAEIAHLGLTHLEVVDTMHKRKARMAELADAFLALPGGFGTFDELFEVLTWTQLGLQAKPVALANVNNYFDGLISQTRMASESGFMKPVHAGLLQHAETPAEAIDLLLAPVPLPEPKWADR